MGYVSFFENFIQIAILIAWAIVVTSFFILAVQLLRHTDQTDDAGGLRPRPLRPVNKTSFLAEKVLGNVVASGVKILVLAVMVGIGTSLFSQFTQGFQAAISRRSQDALSLVLAALSHFWPSVSSVPASRRGLSRSAAARRWGGGRRGARGGRSRRGGVIGPRAGAGALVGAASSARGGAAMAGGAATAYGLAAASSGETAYAGLRPEQRASARPGSAQPRPFAEALPTGHRLGATHAPRPGNES